MQEDGDYGAANRNYGPRFGPFRSEDELRLVLGMTDRLKAAMAPLVSVWSLDSEIDRSVAPGRVLEALESGGDTIAQSQLDARKAGHAAGADRPPSIGEPLTIVARVETPDLIIERKAVIQIGGDRRAPYTVLAWQ